PELFVTMTTFYGYIAHFSTMKCERIRYTSIPSANLPYSTFPTNPAITIITISPLLIYKESLVTFALNLICYRLSTIFIYFPPQVLAKDDCYQSQNSEIPILSCTINTSGNFILVKLEKLDYPTTPKILRLSVVAKNGGSTGWIGNFIYYAYVPDVSSASSTT